jgi:peptidoglycan-N-acetylglucosamine deacetylase
VSRPVAKGVAVIGIVTLVAVSALEIDHLLGVRGYGASAPVCRVATTDRVVALSFDDGPDPSFTPRVLALLERTGARATFFAIGSRAEDAPGLVRRELAAGEEVGDHTWSHPRIGSLGDEEAATQVDSTARLLAGLGADVTLFRAPFGEITPSELSLVSDAGLRAVHWSIAVDHYVGGMGLSPSAAAAAIAGTILPGDIVLAHDAALGPERWAALRTLELLLPMLKSRGFEVTTVGRLLGMGRPVPARPRPWFWQSGFDCPRS